MTDPEVIRAVDDAVARLREHFDCVQVLVSWDEGIGTKNIYRGFGNWFARQGMAHEFIEQDRAQEHAHQIAAKLKDEDGPEFS